MQNKDKLSVGFRHGYRRTL